MRPSEIFCFWRVWRIVKVLFISWKHNSEVKPPEKVSRNLYYQALFAQNHRENEAILMLCRSQKLLELARLICKSIHKSPNQHNIIFYVELSTKDTKCSCFALYKFCFLFYFYFTATFFSVRAHNGTLLLWAPHRFHRTLL